MYTKTLRINGLQGDATPKQIEYAESIAELLGVGMPVDKTKQNMSDFIARYAMRYKETLAEIRQDEAGRNYGRD